MTGAGLFKDFWNAFTYAFSETDREGAAVQGLERAVLAVVLARKTLTYTGCFITVFSFIIILMDLDDISMLGPSLSVSMLGTFYAILAMFPLSVLENRLKGYLSGISSS